jgi:hypothetical protein
MDHHRREKDRSPRSNLRKLVLMALAGTVCLIAMVAACLLLILCGIWMHFRDLASQKIELTSRIQNLEREIKEGEEYVRRREVVEKWTRGDVVWLDELSKLSRDFPPANEAIVLQLQASSRAEGGGTTRFGACASDHWSRILATWPSTC